MQLKSISNVLVRIQARISTIDIANFKGVVETATQVAANATGDLLKASHQRLPLQEHHYPLERRLHIPWASRQVSHRYRRRR
jgi:hypothetical protein